jgi:putative hydrolase
MWREGERLDHRALALTDHIGLEEPGPLLDRLREEAGGCGSSAFQAIVGVELTLVPPERIAEAARRARRAGAEIVIVHGETAVEHVAPGTNHAAIESGEVDVLAHPGLIDERDVELARAHSVVLEISGSSRHSICNGHVVRSALAAGTRLVVDSDAHAVDQLLPLERARMIARGAGVPETQLDAVLFDTPRELIRRLQSS